MISKEDIEALTIRPMVGANATVKREIISQGGLDHVLEFEDGSRLSWQVTSGPDDFGNLIVTISAKHTGGIAELVAESASLDADRSIMREWFKQATIET